MARRSKEDIEADEKRLLGQLERNCDLSLNALAKKLGFSRQKTWRIYTRLKRETVIYGHHAVVNRRRLGLRKYMLLVKMAVAPMDRASMAALVEDGLQKKADGLGVVVDGLYFVNGRYDFVVSVVAAATGPVKTFQAAMAGLLRGIRTVDVLEELVTLKEDTVLHPDRSYLKEFF